MKKDKLEIYQNQLSQWMSEINRNNWFSSKQMIVSRDFNQYITTFLELISSIPRL